jgi:hypothetical protein
MTALIHNTMTPNQYATLRALREHAPGGYVYVDVAGPAAEAREAGEDGVLLHVIVEHPDTRRRWRLVVEPSGDEQPLTLSELADQYEDEAEADDDEAGVLAAHDLTPDEARRFAAELVAAADDVERRG